MEVPEQFCLCVVKEEYKVVVEVVSETNLFSLCSVVLMYAAWGNQFNLHICVFIRVEKMWEFEFSDL